MSKEGLIIEFNELYSSEIEKGTEFVDIVKMGDIKRYRVVDTKEKLLEYLGK
jgi:hypothetical protein